VLLSSSTLAAATPFTEPNRFKSAGDDGATGPTGPPGAPGSDGAQGPAGPSGPQGPHDRPGYGNTAVGIDALLNNITGTFNTAIGTDSLYANITGSSNIALGSEAGKHTTGNNNISIGNLGVAGEDNKIRIGTAGVHTTFWVPVIPTYPSSRRFKENITSMTDASEGLEQLRPVSYRYKEGHGDGGKHLQYGLIAEEVFEVFPEMVDIREDGTVEGIRYGMLTPLMLNELQKKDAEISELRERVARLEGLASRLASIEKQLDVPTAAGAEANAPQGPQGNTGATGPPGNTGATGATGLQGSARLLFAAGFRAQKAGRLGRAIEHYERHLLLEPAAAQSHFNLAHALMETGEFARAIEHFERALELRPDYGEVHLHLATCLGALGDEPARAREQALCERDR
jgi:hypothetical protein